MFYALIKPILNLMNMLRPITLTCKERKYYKIKNINATWYVLRYSSMKLSDIQLTYAEGDKKEDVGDHFS